MEEYFSRLHQSLIDPERLPVALTAILVLIVAGMVTGPRNGNAYPMYWAFLDFLSGKFGGRLDRRQRKAADLLFRGFILTVLVMALSFAVGQAAENGSQVYTFYRIPEILCLCLTMTAGTVWFSLLQLYFALKEKKVVRGAYYTIAHSTRIDLGAADDYTITRTGMALSARAFDKGLVAPALWYLIAGLPAAFLYAGVAAMAWRFGRDGFTKGFGVMALKLEKLMGFVPTLLAGVLIALAGLFTPTGGMTRALKGMLHEEGRATYEEGGLPLTALAYALDVALGGPVVDQDGSARQNAWIGIPGATARLDATHLRRAIYISVMAHLLFAASLGGAMVYGNLLF